MRAAPTGHRTGTAGRSAATGSDLRRTLTALLPVELFSGFQQSYFTPLLPTTGERFHVGVTALAWAVTGPALAAAIATPLLTALGDRHGHLRVLRATVAAVAVGAVLIAVAPDIGVLLVGRTLQGTLAGFLPLMFGLVRLRHTISDTRRAVAYLSGALMLGVLLGSVSSSLLLRVAGATPVLWVPAVGTLAGLVLLGTVPRGEPSAGAPVAGRIDWGGAVLLSAGLVLAVLALHQGAAWGWTAPRTLGCLGAGVLMLAAWAALQLRSAAPLIDVRRLFRPRLLPVFAVGCCVYFVVIGGQVSFAAYLTDRGGLGLKPATAGLVLLPAFCAMAASAAATSRFGRAAGFRRVTVTGAGLLAAGAVGLLLRHSTAVEVAGELTLAGAGLGLVSGAGRVLVIDGVRVEETAAAEGLFEVLIGLGTAVGSAASAAVLAARSGDLHGYRTVWTVGAGVALVGLAAALCLPRPGGRTD